LSGDAVAAASEALDHGSGLAPDQNIENNPMQRSLAVAGLRDAAKAV